MKVRHVGNTGEKMHYTVSVKKYGVKTISDGHDWGSSLPDEWFGTKKYHFDGNDYGPLGSGTLASKREYTLFWYPKSFKFATELLTLIHKKKSHSSMKSCSFSLHCRRT